MPNPITQPDASKPDTGVQISTVEIKTQPKIAMQPKAINKATTAEPGLVAQGTTPSVARSNAVPTAPKNSKIPPGFKLVQKPLGNGTFSLVLRKMSPEELVAAGQTGDTNAGPKPATISSPASTPSTPNRSVTAGASFPATLDKPDVPDTKSESTSSSTSRSANLATGATTIMGGLVMATEGFAKMAEHGMKIHSTLTGSPLPNAPGALAGTPAPAATSKPAETTPGTTPQIHSRLVVPTNASNTLAIAPATTTGLVPIPMTLQAPLTQVAAQTLAGQPASNLPYYTNSVVANTTQTAAQSNTTHACGSAPDNIHPGGHDSDHALGSGDDSRQQHDDSIPHDHHDDQSSPQAPDEDYIHEHQDGDIPYEPQEGDIPYEPEEGDLLYEPEEGDVPYDPQEDDIPEEPQDGDIPYEPEEGDIPYDDQDENPLQHADATVPDDFESRDQEVDANGGEYDDDEGYDLDDEPDDDFNHELAEDDAY